MLVLWDGNTVQAMATNSNGNAINIEWNGRDGIATVKTRCSVVWQNQFYFIGQVSIIFDKYVVE